MQAPTTGQPEAHTRTAPAPTAAAPPAARLDGSRDPAPVHEALPRATLRAALLTVDALIFALAFLASTAIRLSGDPFEIDLLGARLVAVVALMIVGLSLHDAYDVSRLRNGQELLRRVALGSLVGLGLIVVLSYVLPQLFIGRGMILLHAGLAFPLLLSWRRFAFRVVRETSLRPRALVLGDLEPARKVARALEDAPFGGAEVLGILTPKPVGGSPQGTAPRPDHGVSAAPPRGEDEASAAKGSAAPASAAPGSASASGVEPAPPPANDPGTVLGTYADLAALVEGLEVSQLFVVAGARDPHLPLDPLVALRARGLDIDDGAEAYEALTGKILIEKLTPGWLLFANGLERTPRERALRRVIEAGAALVLLALLAPLMALVAIAVRLTSPGPILFRQVRTGELGRPFELLKFRTMREDAEAKSGPVWAQARDPRVTAIGGLLRSTRLDELPQLWNVLRGDMYFVGPRPERPEFVAMLRERIPCFDMRHSVKPGITGWAQINYRYGASVEDAEQKLHYDLFYIQNMSMLLDLDIVIGTVRVMLGAENAH